MLHRRQSVTFWVIAAALVAASCARPPVMESTGTLRIWQTEWNPAAVAVLHEIAEDMESAHPEVVVEIENITWGRLSSKILDAVEVGHLPDVAHLQPFMVASMVHQRLLEPLDDLYRELDADDIYPIVRDLQRFDGRRYGIAHALGITFYGYRKDVAQRLGLPIPGTWADYLGFVAQMQRAEPDQPGVLLPGSDPYFIDLLAVELLANNGGRLFDHTNRPQLESHPFLEVLRFLAELARWTPGDWRHERFIDQYRHFAGDAGLNVPVTYGRAARRITAYIGADLASPDRFAVMPQPVGPSGGVSTASLDAEAFVIFRTTRHRELAMEFLRRFYQRDNYLRFCRAVPIHLTPIFRSLAESEAYRGHADFRKWKPWNDLLQQRLADGQLVPLLMASLEDRHLPFLMELQSSHIIDDLVVAATRPETDVETAALEAQKKAEALIEELGYREW